MKKLPISLLESSSAKVDIICEAASKAFNIQVFEINSEIYSSKDLTETQIATISSIFESNSVAIKHHSKLYESEDLEKAKVTLALQDMLDKLQKQVEDIAKFNAESVNLLKEAVKIQWGIDAADEFEQMTRDPLTSVYNSLLEIKDDTSDFVTRLLEGETSFDSSTIEDINDEDISDEAELSDDIDDLSIDDENDSTSEEEPLSSDEIDQIMQAGDSRE